MKAVEPAEAPESAAVEVPEVEPEAVEPAEVPEDEATEPAGRWESFEATRPNGDVVVIKRNIDTGEQSTTDK